MKRFNIILLLFCFLGIINKSLLAQEKDSILTAKEIFQNTTISGQYFIAYNYDDKSDLHNFLLKRGYFTINTKLSDVFSVRYTQDIQIDKEGTDAGNVEFRLKYLYLKAKLDNILKNSFIEAGMVHRPWVEFEQHINQYRVQGAMFVERNLQLGSADFGITYVGLLGGKLDKKYQDEVNSKEAGKYGSFAIGIFDGGGYHAIEQNSNKTIETRLTLRPFPNSMPGVQFSHGLAYGKSNLADSIPTFLMNIFMLSSESKFHKFTAQYHVGEGDAEGNNIDALNESYDVEGFSFFGELMIPKTNWAVFSRYDNFKVFEASTAKTETIIAGVAYKFLKNKLVFDYQQVKKPAETINYYEIALEIAF
ncbi:MAG: hypothetical protein P1P88_08965 [Bacteroidales bacterium]|nr:hypothetical protein [Bacteroidales bacterium]